MLTIRPGLSCLDAVDDSQTLAEQAFLAVVAPSRSELCHLPLPRQQIHGCLDQTPSAVLYDSARQSCDRAAGVSHRTLNITAVNPDVILSVTPALALQAVGQASAAKVAAVTTASTLPTAPATWSTGSSSTRGSYTTSPPSGSRRGPRSPTAAVSTSIWTYIGAMPLDCTQRMCLTHRWTMGLCACDAITCLPGVRQRPCCASCAHVAMAYS